MNSHAETQKLIISLIENKENSRKKGKEWNKFCGDVVCRIFMDFISKEIPQNYQVVGPSAYIKSFPTEFDFLIVDKDAEPEKYTNTFEPILVKCGIESKARGIFGGRADIKKNISRIKQNFEKVNKIYNHIEFFYLTYKECVYPKKKTSINYLKETKNILGPYEVFCLQDSRTNIIIDGEWKRLVLFLNKL